MDKELTSQILVDAEQTLRQYERGKINAELDAELEAIAKLPPEIFFEEIPKTHPKTTHPNIFSFDKSQYIKLEGKDYGNGNKWGDCDVSMARIAYSPEIVKIGKKLNCNVQNTGKDSLGRKFIGNINWDEALKIALLYGDLLEEQRYSNALFMRQFPDFLKLLKSGKAYDGNGKKIDPKILENIFNDITQVKSPWRAEWIDGDFKYKDNKLYLAQSHVLDCSGNLIPQYTKALDECLMKDKTPGINLDQWIQNPTRQGLPRKSSEKGDLYYWCPDKDNNSVARFYADDGRTGLNCVGYRDLRGSDRGVRIVLGEPKS